MRVAILDGDVVVNVITVADLDTLRRIAATYPPTWRTLSLEDDERCEPLARLRDDGTFSRDEA